ncbi:uncharacterized protein LOC129698280 [Leucoraja erinacea]|uniref:uncharacterized protein LOC129698280 n=1 Tax=Leucoraja erinaceus TaxID=7782 RepID=UPI002454A9E5|nr:uncharacterized protein LOC129698280 [Leucoraja erinacea]
MALIKFYVVKMYVCFSSRYGVQIHRKCNIPIVPMGSKMASHAQREALRLHSFCKLVIFWLIITVVFARNSRAKTSYGRQELLDLGLLYTTSTLSDFQLPPEITSTPQSSVPAPPTGSARRQRRDCKQRRGKRGGYRARLKLNPHQPALPSIFLANVRSLVNKIDELRLRITSHKRIADCNAMVFTETWFNDNIPDNAIELDGRTVFRADRTAEDSGSGCCWRG